MSNESGLKRFCCDVLVVGGGGAGLRSAIAAKEYDPQCRVVLVTKGKLGKSGVTATACSDRMAFHATLPYTAPGGEDAWQHHADDIYRLGGYVSDERLARILARDSNDALAYLRKLGVPFVKKNGRIDQFVTDGSSYARACYTGPNTAIDIERALVKKVRSMDIQVVEEHMIVDLLTAGQRTVGAVGLFTEKESFSVFEAHAVILATGGAGECYKVNVFPPGMSGDGYAVAYRAGAELVNMEFVQIGLCSVLTRLACSGSMMRAVPRIVNDKGEEFLARYFPGGASNDTIYNTIFAKGASWPVSYESPTKTIDVAVFKEMASGRKVYLDYSRNPSGFDYNTLSIEARSYYDRSIERGEHGDFEKTRDKSPFHRLMVLNPEVIDWLLENGIDISAGDKIEIAPAAQHFQGGVRIGERAETTLAGLYAVGECAGGQHGANRPGGNSLLDGQVFGRIAGESAAEESRKRTQSGGKNRGNVDYGKVELILQGVLHAVNSRRKTDKPPSAPADDARHGVKALLVRNEVQDILSACASVVRTKSRVKKGLARIRELEERGTQADGNGLVFALETRNMLSVAGMIMSAALQRGESRGPHLCFADFEDNEPLARDDSKWRTLIIIRKPGAQGAGAIALRDKIRLGMKGAVAKTGGTVAARRI